MCRKPTLDDSRSPTFTNSSRISLTDLSEQGDWSHPKFPYARQTHHSVLNKLEEERYHQKLSSSPAARKYRRKRFRVFRRSSVYASAQMRIGVFASWAGEERQTRRAKALTPNPDATLATAAANWAMWRASKWLEQERMSRWADRAAFAVMISGSALDEETGGPSGSYQFTAPIPASLAP
jgi:hypothetical protein